jgi:hypothetical protein
VVTMRDLIDRVWLDRTGIRFWPRSDAKTLVVNRVEIVYQRDGGYWVRNVPDPVTIPTTSQLTVSDLLAMLEEAEEQERDAVAWYQDRINDLNDQRREVAEEYSERQRDIQGTIKDLKRRIREHSPLSGETDPISTDHPIEGPIRERAAPDDHLRDGQRDP